MNAPTLSPLLLETRATGRLYRVEPARPDVGRWAGPWTHAYYLTITRLSDGKRVSVWRPRHWSDTDSFAHRAWEAARRAGWRPDLDPSERKAA